MLCVFAWSYKWIRCQLNQRFSAESLYYFGKETVYPKLCHVLCHAYCISMYLQRFMNLCIWGNCTACFGTYFIWLDNNVCTFILYPQQYMLMIFYSAESVVWTWCLLNQTFSAESLYYFGRKLLFVHRHKRFMSLRINWAHLLLWYS
jgi:hypothetical protein